MANVYSNFFPGDDAKLTGEVRLMATHTIFRLTIREGVDIQELTLFVTPAQAADLARQLDRAAILMEHDLEEQTVTLTSAGAAALEEATEYQGDQGAVPLADEEVPF